MKKSILLTAALVFHSFLFAQFDITAGYSMGIPSGKMNQYINLTHSGTLQLNYHFPSNKKIWAGVQTGLGTYAQKRERQTYRFSDGSVTETNVNFSSNVFSGHGVIGYDFIPDGKIIPYVNARGGFTNFFTKIFIADPHDADGCRPLENKNVFGDVVFSGGAGAGAKFDGRKFFRSKDREWMIDISVNYLRGGTLNYLNVRHLQNNEPVADPKKEFTVQFVNVTTNEIHEHKVAQVYTSKLKQMEIRVGFVYKL